MIESMIRKLNRYIDSIKVYYYSFCNNKCANDTLGWGAPTSQVKDGFLHFQFDIFYSTLIK
jgi:hypothetical protein